jgi:signal transduction histidine kinase
VHMMVDARDRELQNLRQEIEHHNSSFAYLQELGARVASSLDLPAVLQAVVDGARELTRARYGALGVFDQEGRVKEFITSGISQDERDGIGDLPQGLGLLGLLNQERSALRVTEIASHPRSVGFPPNHPSMGTFLGAPIRHHNQVLGNLYLTEKENGEEFTYRDEQLLEIFSSQAAMAINNAVLHQQVLDSAVLEERERLAREMHDGVGQVLAYINTQTLAVKKLLSDRKLDDASAEIATMQLVTRELYADVREGILGLRMGPDSDGGLVPALRKYVGLFAEFSEIDTRLEVSDEVERSLLQPTAEIQLMRIIQESLTNVRKHASATRANVQFALRSGALHVNIVDDGKGFIPTVRARAGWPKFGLQTMRERAESVGGTFELKSDLGKGTRVAVQIPVSVGQRNTA